MRLSGRRRFAEIVHPQSKLSLIVVAGFLIEQAAIVVDFAMLRSPPEPPRMPRLVVGVTGHRPHKLDSRGRLPTHKDFDGYDWSNPLRTRLRQEIATTLKLLVAMSDAADTHSTMRALHVDSYLRQVTWRPGFDYHTVPHLAVSGV